MSQSQERSNTRYARRSAEEDRAWHHLYRSAGDPAVATEVVQHLDLDTEAKRVHLALYLRCKEALRKQKARQARNQRIGRFVRLVFSAFVHDSLTAMRKLMQNAGELAIEILPVASSEPAVRRVRKLTRKTEFAQAESAFPGQSPTSAPGQPGGSAERESSRPAKAA